MSNYLEAKADELEALRYIYPEELQEEGEGQFRIILNPDETDLQEPCTLALCVAYTERYPDELPELRLECIEGALTATERETLENNMNTLAQEQIGMAMIFTLASTLKEELSDMVTSRKAERERIESVRVEAELEAEAAKFRGSKVTTENFFAWKLSFDKEMHELELKDKAARKAEEAKRGKFSGRKLFEMDKTLAQSDASYMEEGDVTVDLSLFERELNLDDDDEEDEENMVAAALFADKD